MYLEAEIDLAHLLGWGHICEDRIGVLYGAKPPSCENRPIPKWARDNDEAFKLMVEHELSLNVYGGGVSGTAKYGGGGSLDGSPFCNHETKEAAYRLAIVKTVIRKLRDIKANENPHSPT
jgi:hypothetical protein